MKKKNFLQLLFRNIHIPGAHALHRGLASLSFLEKGLVLFLFLLLTGSTLSMMFQASSAIGVAKPVPGGTLIEGIVGTPRYINPVLALSEADRDLSQLIYSGLMKAKPDGTLVPDLAQEYTVSDNGVTYTFILRDTYFHDGERVTADDVLYTIDQIQNPVIQSPQFRRWEGVVAEKIDDKTVQFTLIKPYAGFLENTTIGILPSHLWNTTSSENISSFTANIQAIGSGPFMIKRIDRGSDGIPHAFVLRPFNKYALGEPYIRELTFSFFDTQNELLNAFKNKTVDSIHSVDPDTLTSIQKNSYTLVSADLPRVFGVYFNQNQAAIFTEKNVRIALSVTAPREDIIDTVLKGHATALTTPIPANLYAGSDIIPDPKKEPGRARELLEEAGFKKNGETGIYESKEGPLAFTITTADTPELESVAILLKAAWEELGAQVTIATLDIAKLQNDVIEQRKYDALLFGQVVGREGELYPFWHSSGRNAPGLNISLYANKKVDDIVETIRTTLDAEIRKDLYASFVEEIQKDTPAVFLYAPKLLYVLPSSIRGVDLGIVESPSERFLNTHTWYVTTKKFWEIFN